MKRTKHQRNSSLPVSHADGLPVGVTLETRQHDRAPRSPHRSHVSRSRLREGEFISLKALIRRVHASFSSCRCDQPRPEKQGIQPRVCHNRASSQLSTASGDWGRAIWGTREEMSRKKSCMFGSVSLAIPPSSCVGGACGAQKCGGCFWGRLVSRIMDGQSRPIKPPGQPQTRRHRRWTHVSSHHPPHPFPSTSSPEAATELRNVYRASATPE